MSIETNNKLVGKLGSSNIKGSGISVKGETGNGIDRIEKTNSVGLIDTYTIYFTDGNTTTFTITNGKNGIDGVNGTNGENGKSLQFNWNGTQLGIRTEGSTEYTYVDLKGNKGDKGDKGDPGEVTLEQLNNATKTTQTTEVSEELTIENCAPVSAKLDIKNGKSKQKVREGIKNILPFADKSSTINGMEIKCIDGELILNGTTTADIYTGNDFFKNNFKFKLSAGNYCFSVKEQPTITPVIKKVSDDSLVFSLALKEGTFKLTEDTEVYLCLYIPSGKTYNEYNHQFMLEKNATTRTTYEPVGTPTILIPSSIKNVGDNGSMNFKLSNEDNSQSRIVSFLFTEGQVLHKRDYLASDGTHHKRKTLILDGTENITYDANINVFTISAVNDIALENGFNASAKNIIISNYFKGSNWYSLYNKLIDNAISGHNSAKVVKIRTTEFTSVDEFKTFLTTQYANGTPVTIEYELAEEIVIPYTTEQKEAYYELQHLLMYEGYTNISCIDEIKPDIKLTYYYNNLLNKSYAKRMDNIEKQVNDKMIKGQVIITNILAPNTATPINIEIPNTLKDKNYIVIASALGWGNYGNQIGVFAPYLKDNKTISLSLYNHGSGSTTNSIVISYILIKN